MTDPDLLAKRLALIETCIHELRTLADIDRYERDIRERRFIEHTLQIAAQATLDVASHIISDQRLGEPETYRAMFRILAEHGWLDAALEQPLSQMAGFRNVLVHGYIEVDPRIVRDVVENRLRDLEAFIHAVRAKASL